MILFMPFPADSAARAKADTATVPAQFRFRGRKLWAFCEFLFLFSAGRAARAKADTATIKAQIRFRSRELWFCFAIFLSSLLFPADCAARAKADTVTIKAQIRFRSRKLWAFLRFLLLFPADCAAKAKADREKVRAHFVVGAGNYWVWAIFYSDAISRRLHGQGKADTVTIVAQFRLRTGKYWLFSFSRIISNRLRGQGKRGHSDGTQRPHCDKKQFPKQFPADCLGRASVTSLRFLAPQCYPQAARSEHKLARQRYR